MLRRVQSLYPGDGISMSPTIRFKYPFECFLEFQSVDRFLYRVSDLYDLDQYPDKKILERLDNCHIYILGKRPRLSAIPDSIRATSDAILFDITYKIAGISQKETIEIPRQILGPEDYTFQISPYPHRELISLDKNGSIVSYTLLANLAHVIPNLQQEAKDLEVIYVGKGLRRSAQDRLENHATLQRILADVNSNDPDSEIFSLVYAFNYRKVFMKHDKQPCRISGDLAEKKMKQALNYKMPLNERISLIEASCISYFRTEKYNTHYLSFPSDNNKILNPVYENDFSAIVVQLDQENIGDLRIFSKTNKARSTHYIIVDFRKNEGFLSIFDAIPQSYRA